MFIIKYHSKTQYVNANSIFRHLKTKPVKNIYLCEKYIFPKKTSCF